MKIPCKYGEIYFFKITMENFVECKNKNNLI